MAKQLASASELTDEQVLKEFVRRFQCEGAILIYLDGDTENWFCRWRNSTGRGWVKDFIAHMQRNLKAATSTIKNKEGLTAAFHNNF
ncbi:MAG TPA: hypothetical protein VF598_04105 [Hymenobacter sp.]|jgi:hypothetical protein